MTAVTTDSTAQKHPPGLYLLFFAEMWERFSFYGNRALLVLFMSKPLMEGGLAYSGEDAVKYYGLIQGGCYLTPLLGGYLADKFLGQRKSILIGGILMAIAQLVLFFSARVTSIDYYWLGISFLIIGNGFFKPNISTLVGRLYPEGSTLKDQAYIIFYMGINVGALSPFLISYLVESYGATFAADGETVTHYGFQWGFLTAAIGMLLGQIIFNLLAGKYLGLIGLTPEKRTAEQKISDKLEPKVPLTKIEIDRMIVLSTITFFSIFFWLGFEQAGGAFTLYTDNYLDRNVLGWKVPTSMFQAINPLFIIILGLPVSLLWKKLGPKNPSLIVKMALGLALMGAGFFLMIGAAVERGGDNAPETALASMWWMVATYFVHTVAELFLSPVGLTAVSKLAPKTLTSVFMGVWFISPFIAHSLAGFTQIYIKQLGAISVFSFIGIGGVVIGILMLLFSKVLVRMMHGAEKSM